jgi:hypothetical protein
VSHQGRFILYTVLYSTVRLYVVCRMGVLLAAGTAVIGAAEPAPDHPMGPRAFLGVSALPLLLAVLLRLSSAAAAAVGNGAVANLDALTVEALSARPPTPAEDHKTQLWRSVGESRRWHRQLGGAVPLFDGVWDTIAEQATVVDPFAKGITHPSIRYSHTAVVWRDTMVITHGYQYNRLSTPAGPAWLHDTWGFSLSKHTWTMLNDGKGKAPSPRYGHTSFVYRDLMYFFGGDDGDHVASPTNYRTKHYNDFWRFDLARNTWDEVPGRGGGEPWPPPRSLHTSGLVGNTFVIYGGLGLGDTWGYDLGTGKWREFVAPANPGIRYAASYAADASHMYIFGGSREGGAPFDDFWRFELASGQWTELSPAPKQRPREVAERRWPPGRSYGSALASSNPVTGQPMLALFGGANCSRGCTCLGDTWVYDIAAQRFSLVNVPAEPITRYRQTMVERSGKLYVFGGESYKPYMYHNSVIELPLTEHRGPSGVPMLRGGPPPSRAATAVDAAAPKTGSPPPPPPPPSRPAPAAKDGVAAAQRWTAATPDTPAALAAEPATGSTSTTALVFMLVFAVVLYRRYARR